MLCDMEAPDVICESFQLENMFPLCGQLECLLSVDIVLCSHPQNLPETPSAVQQGS